MPKETIFGGSLTWCLVQRCTLSPSFLSLFPPFSLPIHQSCLLIVCHSPHWWLEFISSALFLMLVNNKNMEEVMQYQFQGWLSEGSHLLFPPVWNTRSWSTAAWSRPPCCGKPKSQVEPRYRYLSQLPQLSDQLTGRDSDPPHSDLCWMIQFLEDSTLSNVQGWWFSPGPHRGQEKPMPCLFFVVLHIWIYKETPR